MDATHDTNWLMQYRLLRLVNQCRRLIQSEFGVRLHLTDADLRERLSEFAGRTRTQSLQRVYAELRLALIDFEGPDTLLVTPPPTVHQKRYRGQLLDDGKPEDGGSSVAESTPATRTTPETLTPNEEKKNTGKPQRIYRGRIIND